jgi:hypothetical protein
MSDPVDDHIAKAFASLADVSARELEATAEALGHRRRDPLGDFAGVFREVACRVKTIPIRTLPASTFGST